ncbi:signal peptidase I SipW [Gracilibacillus lacisalsi]|uniref:signal peptidase I SipW n=1 Tax=Gracilibacillus lacisalsi TaxID=393087 RepID=UPI0003728CC2|nr:signal peptidase I [Gracilibacillus lacisalsi]
MKWNKIFKMINNIITGLLFIVLVFSVIVVISVRASGGEPTVFGHQLKTVLSGSMEPEIQTGSIILIQVDGDMTRFDEGDVITFRTKDNILITHRIVEVKGNGQQYITEGDNNDGPDMEPVLSENIVGQYTGIHLPYVGYITNFANTKQGLALLFIVPGVFLLIYSVISIWQALKQLDSQQRERTEESKIVSSQANKKV